MSLFRAQNSVRLRSYQYNGQGYGVDEGKNACCGMKPVDAVHGKCRLYSSVV